MQKKGSQLGGGEASRKDSPGRSLSKAGKQSMADVKGKRGGITATAKRIANRYPQKRMGGSV